MLNDTMGMQFAKSRLWELNSKDGPVSSTSKKKMLTGNWGNLSVKRDLRDIMIMTDSNA